MITRNLDTNAQMTRVSSMDPYVLISAKVCTSNGILSKTWLKQITTNMTYKLDHLNGMKELIA